MPGTGVHGVDTPASRRGREAHGADAGNAPTVPRDVESASSASRARPSSVPDTAGGNAPVSRATGRARAGT